MSLVSLNLWRRLGQAAAVILLLWVPACIVPPSVNESSVLSQEELELVSIVTLAKDYSKRGRMDLAEIELRKALRLRADSANIYNDLGFVLQSQARNEEARQMYQRALELQPDNVVARDNLARLYYNAGEYRAALLELLKLIDSVNSADPEGLSEELGQTVDQQYFVGIYRKMATIYYTVGVYDDAECYSALAFTLGANIDEAGQHSRMLLSLDRIATAEQVLGQVVTARSGDVPAKILCDYSMALYLSGNSALANVAVRRVLAAADADLTTRQTARMLGVLMSQTEGHAKESETLSSALLEEAPELCADVAEKVTSGQDLQLDIDHFWPLSFTEQVSNLLLALCDEQIKSVTAGT